MLKIARLQQLGSNLYIQDKKLLITVNNYLKPFIKYAPELNAKLSIVRTQNNSERKTKTSAKTLAMSTLLGDLDSNQDSELQRLESYHWTIPE